MLNFSSLFLHFLVLCCGIGRFGCLTNAQCFGLGRYVAPWCISVWKAIVVSWKHSNVSVLFSSGNYDFIFSREFECSRTNQHQDS